MTRKRERKGWDEKVFFFTGKKRLAKNVIEPFEKKSFVIQVHLDKLLASQLPVSQPAKPTQRRR